MFNILKSKMADEFHISYTIDKNYNLFSADQARNSNINKIDFVVYPQLALQNTSLNQIYETQFNLAPAMEMDLWSGMQFTGQVIFPIINDLGPQGDQIRPGFVNLAQNFRIGKTVGQKGDTTMTDCFDYRDTEIFLLCSTNYY